ncbi:uncharacterized protein LOC124420340 [Lucilia cuprina]|uniref:uncharacterized protein LOC124420340 n=1 Tax=Lucilia cuprina TaxID=7375 RepID=UPI001F05D115|nr:uncharacterized protein LOC124420340 [Lucilia cuprina]
MILILCLLRLYIKFNEKKIIFNKNKLKVDQRSEPGKFDIQERIAKHIPYLPIEDLETFLVSMRSYNLSCAWYPGIMDIHIQNEYWQILRNRNLTYHLFGAYLDNRPYVTNNRILIRILTMIDLISKNPQDYPTTYCQFWFREKFQPIIVPVEKTQLIWRYEWPHDSQYSFPYILTCTLPKDYEQWLPKSVSLVAAPCDKATNMLRVIYRPLKATEKKKEFAVCIKGLDFPYIDLSYRVVEYLETLRVLGAEKVIMYNLEIHENTTKVLEYYQRTGFVEYRPFSFSLKYSNYPDYRHRQIKTKPYPFILHEGIAYNDCIYRNMYRFQYIGVWDIDELPLPLKNYTKWHDLVKVAAETKNSTCRSYKSLCFLCAYFPDYQQEPILTERFPNYFYMLQHVRRVKEHASLGKAMKCFHNTDYIIATHNHFAIHYVVNCNGYTFPATDAQMNHYREPPKKEDLSNLVLDKRLWRHGNEIVEKSLKIYEELNFFEEV